MLFKSAQEVWGLSALAAENVKVKRGGRMTINEQKSLETSCVRVCTYCSRGPSRRLERTDKLLWTREPPLTLYVVILASRVERVQTGGRMVL